MEHVNAVAEFESTVLKSDMPVLVDFYATWCGPCKMIAPILEEIAAEMAGKAKVVKVDVDQASDLALKYNIRSVPTLMFFKNGEIADQVLGANPKNVLVDKLTALV